jgi:putative hemolysin
MMHFESFLRSARKRKIAQQRGTMPAFCIHEKNYTIKIAQTEEELDAALKLRFEVFNLELGEGLESSFLTLRDEDKFDRQFDHLLIIDNDKQAVIGTYRMQTYETAQQQLGFYSDAEFCLEMLPKEILMQSVELGRACILKEYRNRKVLFLLWRGIANYIYHTHKRYLFGCCSLTSQDPIEGYSLLKQLKDAGHIEPVIQLDARGEFALPKVNNMESLYREIEMPPLLGMYLRYGAKVVGQPAIDREFKTIDYLVILDVEQFGEEAFNLFLG